MILTPAITINQLLDLINEKFPIPAQFNSTCFFEKKSFPLEFGTYHEIVIYFDDVVFDKWKDLDDEFTFNLFDDFWDWLNEVKAFNLESEEITQQIQELYFQSRNT